jgi:hypothetical protein
MLNFKTQQAMTTYTISRLQSNWHVHLYDEERDHISAVATDFRDEERATRFALLNAQQHRPSKVLKISEEGDKKTVATFGDTRAAKSVKSEE